MEFTTATRVPELSTLPSQQHSIKNLESWSKRLPQRIQHTLLNSTGKPNNKLQWTAEIVFRHCLPIVLLHGAKFLNQEDLNNLDMSTPLVGTLVKLVNKYGMANIDKVEGFKLYKNFKDETDFDEERIKKHTAVLLQTRFDVVTLLQTVKGTHTGAHRNVKKSAGLLHQALIPSYSIMFVRYLREERQTQLPVSTAMLIPRHTGDTETITPARNSKKILRKSWLRIPGEEILFWLTQQPCISSQIYIQHLKLLLT